MKFTALIISCLLSFSAAAFAQNNQRDPNNPGNQEEATDKQGRNGYWEANLSGGNYVVALGRISSVSRHQYVLDGALIVDEVTVDTTGQALARFYFITPIGVDGPAAAAAQAAERVLELADGVARQTGTDVQDMAVKKYPDTTHAKSIEYRLLSEEQLNVLYKSLKTAWQSGKGRIFSEG